MILFVLGAVLLAVYMGLEYKAMKDKADYEKVVVRFEDLKEYTVELQRETVTEITKEQEEQPKARKTAEYIKKIV